jgi:hypothetical protein
MFTPYIWASLAVLLTVAVTTKGSYSFVTLGKYPSVSVLTSLPTEFTSVSERNNTAKPRMKHFAYVFRTFIPTVVAYI